MRDRESLDFIRFFPICPMEITNFYGQNLQNKIFLGEDHDVLVWDLASSQKVGALKV
jgi:hypothetical protein